MRKHHLVITAAVLPLMAHAEWFSFNAITTNTNGIDEIAESQLFMEVQELGNGQATITFTNTGPISSTLEGVYFYTRDGIDPVGLQISVIGGSPDVSFAVDTQPSDLPAGNTFLVGFTVEQSADSNPPPSKRGVEAYEYLTMSATYNDPPYTMIELLVNQDLQVGLHAISINGLSSYSSSLLNDTTVYDQIPEPSTILLLGFGTLGLLGIKRRLRM